MAWSVYRVFGVIWFLAALYLSLTGQEWERVGFCVTIGFLNVIYAEVRE